MTPELEVTATPDDVARTVARRLVARLLALQSQGVTPSIVLTGGTIAEKVHRSVLSDARRDDVDWGRVEVWFGDERFVPDGDPDRNAVQARAAFLDDLPLDPARVHEMPPSGGAYGDDVDAAAAAYAAELVDVLGAEPRFDVLMLGIGPDGHCASLFPGHEAVDAEGLAVAVRHSPKPPPTRISLTMPALTLADEVWFIGSGAEKADAVAAAVHGSDVGSVPAAGPRGRRHTVWFLDTDAAAGLGRPSES